MGDKEEGEVTRDISHFAIEPSLLAVNRYLQSSLVTAHVRGKRWTLLLVVAEDVGVYDSCKELVSLCRCNVDGIPYPVCYAKM